MIISLKCKNRIYSPKFQIFWLIFLKKVSIVNDSDHSERFSRDFEAHIEVEERHAVDALRVVVITGTGILCQRGLEGIELLSRHKGCQMIGKDHLEGLPPYLIDKSAAGIRMGIGIGHIRLHIVDGRAIHQIGTLYPDDWSQLGIDLHTREAYTRESQVIGTERGTRGEDTQTAIATQTWWTNCEALLGLTVL